MTNISRRGVIGQGLALGCSLAASPLVTPMSFAATGGENRLVVIILRGGLDGLDLLRPPMSEQLLRLRPQLSQSHDLELELDNGFSMHPAARALWPLWEAGELAFAQAVSTPYRHKRSHFDGQDLLEAGTAALSDRRSKEGWLNRMLQQMPGAELSTAYAIGADPMLLSRGAASVETWSPDVNFVLSSQGARLLALTLDQDPAMARAMSKAMTLAAQSGGGPRLEVDHAEAGGLAEMMDAQMESRGKSAGQAHRRIAQFAAERLREEARIACFSLGGWDTHANQARGLTRPLGRLSDSLLTLKSALGAQIWARTTILAMTEFGRTVAENGTGGTDHGTGGTMLLAGGALRGQRILGRWPGLDEADLFERRDLMPTEDVRRFAAWAIRESFGLSRAVLEQDVFPGVTLGERMNLLA